MNQNTKYEWRYAIPASDRFFNVIGQDEDTPVDGNEDERALRSVTCSASPGVTARLSARREPMADGGAQKDARRIRYTRVLPLQLSVETEGPGQVHIALAVPVSLRRAERLHLWLLASPEWAAAGCALWAVTTRGDVLLDGDCAGRRWRFCEARLEADEDGLLTGLRLDIGGACRGLGWFDALRVGCLRGFSPFIEPHTAAGCVAAEPPRMEKGSLEPLRIVYTADAPLAAGTELAIHSPVLWFFQAENAGGTTFVSATLQHSGLPAEPLAVDCRRCAHTRWRTRATIRLYRTVPAGTRLTWTIRAIDWNHPDNRKCGDRSFSLFIKSPGESAARRHETRPVIVFTDSTQIPPDGISIRGSAFRRTECEGLVPFFGYLHAHSDISEDGRQSPAACYQFGRDVAQLDFCALSDHFWAHEPAWKWDCIQQVAANFYRPGEFVTFPAYEWSSQDHGDRNVYFLNEGPPCCVGPIESTPDELYEQIENLAALVIPHSPAFEIRARGVNWDYFHPGLERLVEIYSSHGSSEGQGGNRYPLHCAPMLPEDHRNSVQAALARGYELGLVAGGDDHCRPCPRRSGLAGVWAERLTRESIFDALYNRRCFGTTAPAMSVEFRVNGRWMGQRLELPAPRSERAYFLRFVSAAPIRQVDWIHNGRCEKIWRPEGSAAMDFSARWCDASLVRALDYSYVRAHRVDGHMAWSSPVFVRVNPE